MRLAFTATYPMRRIFKCYIHPDNIEAYPDGTLAESLKGRGNDSGLPPEEAAVLRLLRRHLAVEDNGHK